jgi:mRNA-degrading endonuclease RelE of RelBE toxin-antitoxin system
MSYKLVVTPFFERELKRLAKKYPSIKEDYRRFLTELAANPTRGSALGQDCYKVRMAIASKNRGKSGGARIITCVKVVREAVYLLKLYDKSDQDSISEKERDELLRDNGLL